MRTCYKRRVAFAAMLLVGSGMARSQSAADHATAAVESNKIGVAPSAASILREIDDPCTGARWLLVQDPAHPESPGRLVLSASEGLADDTRQQTRSASGRAQSFAIHAGDALLVEEHTAVVDAQLEATALGSAVRGAEFRARLKIGGKAVRALAIAPGRAALVHEREPRP